MRRIITLVTMLVIMGIPALAQDGYVSSPIVHAMEGGKFYLKMGGSVAVPDNDMGGYVKWTTQDTQIGRIKRRKDIVTASYGFFSVSGGSYAPKLR